MNNESFDNASSETDPEKQPPRHETLDEGKYLEMGIEIPQTLQEELIFFVNKLDFNTAFSEIRTCFKQEYERDMKDSELVFCLEYVCTILKEKIALIQKIENYTPKKKADSAQNMRDA